MPAPPRNPASNASPSWARDVILPELEGGLEVLRFTLLVLGYPPLDVQHYSDTVRRDQYDFDLTTSASLSGLIRE